MKTDPNRRSALLRRAKYEIYRVKKKELLNYIVEQTEIWGSYQNIPPDVAAFIDREFTKLGLFGKKIDAGAMENAFMDELPGSPAEYEATASTGGH